MAEPQDQTPAAAGRGGLRASHADREQVIGTLKAAFVQGMLAKDGIVCTRPLNTGKTTAQARPGARDPSEASKIYVARLIPQRQPDAVCDTHNRRQRGWTT